MKKTILTLLLLGGLYSSSIIAQEVRVQGNMLILGEINNPFIGAGAGIEAGMGQHFTLNFDINWGTQDRGTTWEFRPSVNYYIGKEQRGLFFGPAFKYIRLTESEADTNRWDDSLYSIGFNLGFKALLSDKMTFAFITSPHKTVGGREESDVAGISAQMALGYRF